MASYMLVMKCSPASGCSGQGPERYLRAAYHWVGVSRRLLLDIYDNGRSCLAFPPLFICLEEQQLLYYSWLLTLADTELLQYTSTSPCHEAQTYAAGEIAP